MTLMDTDKGNGIRTGEQYLKGLQDDREIWTGGKRIADVTKEDGIKRGIATLGKFLDRQHDEKYQDTVTYVAEDGIRCAKSFMKPKSKADIKSKGQAYYEWAKWSAGMFGRTPDYKNASLMSFASATSFLAQGTKGNADFAQNMTDFYDHVRTNDKVLTHTLVNPQVSHAQATAGKFNADVALHVTKETDAGIYVHGARLLATLGPSADEIEVFPSTVLRSDPDNVPFAFAFAIPIATPGLKMICRDTYDNGKSTFDAPLASRFEEMDAVVIFDNVFVPWERVFMYRDKDMAMKGIISEVMLMTETVRALLYQAESEAHEDEFGNFIPLRGPLDTSRNLFPKFYPRMVEILQMMGSSSLMATPTEADFSNEMAADVEQYFQVANLGAKDRVALYRLAHDVAISGFGNRQTLYERFFFGPPHLMNAAYFDLYDRDRVIDRVDTMLAGN